MHSNQKAELGRRDEAGVSRMVRMREDGDHYGELIQEDSIVTTSLQCSMHALLEISYPNHHV